MAGRLCRLLLLALGSARSARALLSRAPGSSGGTPQSGDARPVVQGQGSTTAAACEGRPQYAIAFFGGVSLLKHDTQGLGSDAFDVPESRFVNVSIVGNAVRQHIIEANGGRKNVKVFIHSWAYPLKERLLETYAPTLSVFEDETTRYDQLSERVKKTERRFGYNPWSGAAAALSMQKSLALVRQYEEDCNHTFDKVVLYRPDVLLWGKDMDLSKYNGARVTANGHDGLGRGDFHWVMNSTSARRFKPFESISPSVKLEFGWIRDYIHAHVTPGVQPIGDDIKPCWNQEVFRKIAECTRKNKKKFTKKDVRYLGVTDEVAAALGFPQ